MEFEDSERPIIVRRIKKVSHGHHGGAWKVAFADFAVAMMAFFLVLWLMEATTVEEKNAISGYFNDPSAFTEGGSPYIIDLEGSLKDTDSSDDGGKEETMSQEELQKRRIIVDENTVQNLAQQIEAKKFKELQSTLEAKIDDNPELEKYKEQIIIEVTDDGLQIQIVDKDSRPMFDSGSNQIKAYTTAILEELAETIGTLNNKISISGHTDAAAFTERKDYSNWELSSERANSARRSLVEGGIDETKIAQVVGLASSSLYDQANPLNPTNRRISILVLSNSSAQRMARQQQGSSDKKDKDNPLPEDPEFDSSLQEGLEEIPEQPQTTTPDDIESLDIEIDEDTFEPAKPSPPADDSSPFEQIRKTIDQRTNETDTQEGDNGDGEFF
ncbi:hypothetical protein A9Q99_16295 [Gammaproteobacteria bacterium 45_16_T64]|nr:hypothetical protein A9Q99_16295 [Gammaproteobacteria bacterium 45_16_T64]